MRVWFFKTYSEEYDTDTISFGYEPHFIPVLDQTYTSDALIRLLQQGPSTTGITGIIITSQRSVTTLSQTCPALSDQQCQSWQGIPLYIVGEATTTKLEKDLDQRLFFSPHHSRPPITTTHHASQLADHLLQQQQQHQQQYQHFLFLAGDKRREELPKRLCESGHRLTEIQTYETCRHPDLTLQLARQRQHHRPFAEDWSVFFSPSGVDYILSLQQPDMHWPLKSTKIAAIGNTTASHLQSLGYQVHAIAAKPRVSQLLDAIVAYDQNQAKSM